MAAAVPEAADVAGRVAQWVLHLAAARRKTLGEAGNHVARLETSGGVGRLKLEFQSSIPREGTNPDRIGTLRRFAGRAPVNNDVGIEKPCHPQPQS